MKPAKNLYWVFLPLLILAIFAAAQEKSDSSDQSAYETARKYFEEAKKSVYEKNWSKAVEKLEMALVKAEGTELHAETLYWLGYSLSKQADSLKNFDRAVAVKEEAIGFLNEAIEFYPSSSYVQEAKLLRIDIASYLVEKGYSDFRIYINGYAEETEEQDPEVELKLVALNALLNMDPEKAFPVLEKMVREEKNPKLREQALFILAQNSGPRVVPILLDVAKKDPDPEMRENAVFWLGQRKDEESFKALLRMYDEAQDPELKESLIFAISQNGSEVATAKLIEIARKDKDPEIKEEAVFWLGQRKSAKILDILYDLYVTSSDQEFKEQVIFALTQVGGDESIRKLIDMARKEENIELKKEMIFWLGQSKHPEAVKFLKEIIEK